MPERTHMQERAYARREYHRALRNTTDRRLRLVSRLRRIFGWVTAAAFVLFFAANLSLFSRNSLRQLQMFAAEGLTAAPQGNIIQYEASGTVSAVSFADGMAIADNDVLTLQKPGTVQLTEPLGYGAPVLNTVERYALVYDRGGFGATLASPVAVASKQQLDSPILFGCVGENGDYALVTNEAGYKSAVTVFSSGGKQRFKWATPDYYLQAAALSADGKWLVVAAFQQDGTTFESSLIFRALDSESIEKKVSLNSVVPMAVGFLNDNTVAVVGDHQTAVVNRKGNIVHEMNYASGDLNAYKFGGDAITVAVRSYASTARVSLITIDGNGRESDPLSVSEDLQAIDYDGARLALLTTGGLIVYDSNLRALWSNVNAVGARDVCLAADGTVWAVYPKQAERISSQSDTSEVLK